ncbi:autotransporter secretion outer membrane protein TamA [Thiomonas bhubaneswarensis]|uniref:Translocation and assembly module subunit TamA n=2 Tax=Thiomonas bhubaneswarensis TaxID=339866 RepID=A0A0K6I8A5_9BURK|nr:autotransporter secretion outer membrane protein TamA [Thiomonas bhubaneswarensis]
MNNADMPRRPTDQFSLTANAARKRLQRLALASLFCATAGLTWPLDAAAAEPEALTPAAQPAVKPKVEPPLYEVRLDVPKDLQPLLSNNLDLLRWRDFPDLQRAQVQRLADDAPAQVQRLLETQGYFSPQIKVRVDCPESGPIEVVLSVETGSPTQVQSVDLLVDGPDGKPDAALSARLSRFWALKPGEVFRDADWEAAKSKALSSLLSGRWPAARLAESRATVDPQTHEARLLVRLQTGPAYVFGGLHFSGQQRYPVSIAERLAPMRPGEPYSQSALLDYQAALQNSPYYRNALVDADLHQAEGDAVPVDVRLTENPAQKLSFGVGVSSDTGERVQMGWQDLNFLGRAWRLSSDIKLQTREQSGSLKLAFPRTADGYDDSVSLLQDRTDISGLVTRNSSVGAQRERTRGRIATALALQYQAESLEPAGAASSEVHALSLNYSWTRTDVNSVLYPSRGSVINLQLGGASKALLSSANFVRLYARGLGYLPIDRSNQLVFRAEAGAVLANGANGIPQNFLFRAGGANSVRGYAYQSLGLVQGDAIVGGRYLFTASAEFDHWFTRQWGGAVFYDLGNAADTWGALKPVRGYGAGVRWRSPVGLIAVDLAYGQAVHQYRLNFTAGLSF